MTGPETRGWLVERASQGPHGEDLAGVRLSVASRGQKIRHLRYTGWTPEVVEDGLVMKGRRRPAELWCRCGEALTADRIEQGLSQCGVCR